MQSTQFGGMEAPYHLRASDRSRGEGGGVGKRRAGGDGGGGGSAGDDPAEVVWMRGFGLGVGRTEVVAGRVESRV